MSDLKREIYDFLIELREQSKQITTDPRPTMRKYDMLFIGANFNVVTSLEMLHSLNTRKNINVTN